MTRRYTLGCFATVVVAACSAPGVANDSGGSGGPVSAPPPSTARAAAATDGASTSNGAAPATTTPTVADGGGDAGPASSEPDAAGPPPAFCATNPWQNLAACGWAGPGNTGPDLTHCPGGLTPMGSGAMPMPVLEISEDARVVSCARVLGELHVTGKNVVIKDSVVTYDTGLKGTAANGSAPIVVDDGGSATIDHVEIDGKNGTHACIWHQGTSMTANAVDCHGVDDGVFSWADVGFSSTTGDNFTITESYFHDFTTLTSNGHEDGYQTEGASHGVIRHNTYSLTTEADSCVAIWDSLRSSSDILVENNLMAGGGAAIYADDYSPSEASPEGGFSVTSITFKDNVFSTKVAPCVGQFFVWYARPAEPFAGGPTDGWTRSGNRVLETGESVDTTNPHVAGALCR